MSRTGNPGSCWLWKGSTNHGGYGLFHAKKGEVKRGWLAHRIAWELVNGREPGRSYVCHSCDTPSCVNPAHLWLGSVLDNNRDAASKWRHTYGERNGMARLSAEDVLRVRELIRCGWLAKEVAIVFGVSEGQVNAAATGRDWSHVPGAVEPRGHGERHPCAKLSDADVADIRERVCSGETQKALAAEYGVHQCTISRIVNRKRRRAG